MKLKLDDKGVAVLQDGMPVYVHDDGVEAPFDAAGALTASKRASGEAKEFREQVKDLTGKLSAFEGLDPKAAKEALATVANLKDKQLVDAGEVDKIKKGVSDSYEAKLADTAKSFEAKITELTGQIESKNAQVRQLLIEGAFTNSKFLAEKTVLPADIAYATFGKHFTIEESNGKLSVVAILDGEKLFSRTNPGQLASAEEAIAMIVEKYPHKDTILRQPGGGGGAGNPGGKRPDGSADFKALYDKAISEKRVQDAIAIKTSAAAAGVFF